jgi:hypothetical protein
MSRNGTSVSSSPLCSKIRMCIEERGSVVEFFQFP